MPPQPPHITPPPPPPPPARPPTERTAAGKLLRIGVVMGVLTVGFAVAGGAAAWFLVGTPTGSEPVPLPAEVVPEPEPAAAEVVPADTGGPDDDLDAASQAADGGEDEGLDGDAEGELGPEDEAVDGSVDGEDGPGEADDGSPAPPAAAGAAEPKPPPSCDVRAVSKRSDGAAVVKKSTLERYVRNPDSVSSLGSFSWKRHKKSKDIRGVRMRRMPCPGLMRAAGLRNGDVVLSVNGTPATSVARGMVIWADVKSSGKARMKVKHGTEGTRTVVVYVRD